WLKPSSAPSSVIMSASVRARMQTPSCTSYQLGSLTTTRFTRTRHSDIVHPVSSSQLTETRDHVRSFGGYNTYAHDEVYYVVSGGRRFAHLFIDPETMMIGTRTDFFPDHNAAYPRGKAREANKTFKEQCREMEKELFEEKDEWTAFHRKTVLKSRLGI